MLGLGWTEMLVIGVVALIFIGPKDLPVVMGRIGKVIGQVQRMGREFQREINKSTGLDEVRNLRTSITSPIKKTAEEIRKDFNAIGKDGKEQPTGALKPTDPNTESVVEAIQQQAGITPAKKSNDELAANYGFKSAEAAKPEAVKAESAKSEPVKAARAAPKAAAPKAEIAAPAKPKAAKPKVTTPAPAKAAKPAKAETAQAPKAARKPASTKAAKPVDETESKPAAKPRAPRRKPAETAGKSE
jgi:sec-independent protein translocase protein TatB